MCIVKFQYATSAMLALSYDHCLVSLLFLKLITAGRIYISLGEIGLWDLSHTRMYNNLFCPSIYNTVQ